MKVILGSDHGGYDLKNAVMRHLQEQGIETEDTGCFSADSCDYPDIAEKTAKRLLEERKDNPECLGMLFCGTGIGISISANKIKGIRAACCSDCFSARMCREHNDANILCMGGRVAGAGLACQMADEFLGAEYLGEKEGGERHRKRVAKITALENGQ